MTLRVAQGPSCLKDLRYLVQIYSSLLSVSNGLRRRARLWSTLLELAWEPSTQEQGGRKHDPGVQSNGAGKADNYMNSSKSRMKSNKRDLRLARRAAVAVLDGGKWDPQKNRELVVMQVGHTLQVNKVVNHQKTTQ